MASVKTLCLFGLLIASSMATVCSAAAAHPAIDSKSPQLNSAEPSPDRAENVLDRKRENHALKSEDSFANYLRAPAPPPAPVATVPVAPAAHPYSNPPALTFPAPGHSNPHETTMGYVYYYLPTVEKYYPKLKDLVPYVRSFSPWASRAWPALRHAGERTLDIGSAIGLVVFAPALLISSILFLCFVAFLLVFPAVSAFGKRRMGRDLSGQEDPDQALDFDQFLPAEQSRKLATLAAQVDGYLDTYRQALMSDGCLERFSCQAGQFSSRLGTLAEPVMNFLEPIVPKYVSSKLNAFKIGARSGEVDCVRQYTCKVPFFG